MMNRKDGIHVWKIGTLFVGCMCFKLLLLLLLVTIIIAFQLDCLRGHSHRTLFVCYAGQQNSEIISRSKKSTLVKQCPSSTYLQKQLKSSAVKCKKNVLCEGPIRRQLTRFWSEFCCPYLLICILQSRRSQPLFSVTSGLVCFTVVETGTNTYLK